MRYRIRHVTRFTYEQPAYESHNEVRLRPRDSIGQRTLGFRLLTRQEVHFSQGYQRGRFD